MVEFNRKTSQRLICTRLPGDNVWLKPLGERPRRVFRNQHYIILENDSSIRVLNALNGGPVLINLRDDLQCASNATSTIGMSNIDANPLYIACSIQDKPGHVQVVRIKNIAHRLDDGIDTEIDIHAYDITKHVGQYPALAFAISLVPGSSAQEQLLIGAMSSNGRYVYVGRAHFTPKLAEVPATYSVLEDVFVRRRAYSNAAVRSFSVVSSGGNVFAALVSSHGTIHVHAWTPAAPSAVHQLALEGYGDHQSRADLSQRMPEHLPCCQLTTGPRGKALLSGT